MATRDEILLFRTPDKQPKPDDQPRSSSTAVVKPFLLPKSKLNLDEKFDRSLMDPQKSQYFPNKNKKQWSQKWSRDQKKNVFLEAKGNDKGNSPSAISFPSHQVEDQDSQSKLKNMSKRVQNFIKDGLGYKAHSHQQEITLLKTENKRIQNLTALFQMQMEVQVNEKQSKNLEKIEKNIKKTLQRSAQILPNANQYKKIQEKKDQQNQSSHIEGISNAKKYLLQYINTVIEANDEKFEAQQKYISVLEKRLHKIEDIRSNIEHLKFQKHVKLQDCTRKSKNYSCGAPIIAGQQLQLNFDAESTPKSEANNHQKRYFKKNPIEQSKQFQEIKQKNISLEQDLQRLQGKYQSQLQRYIKLNSDFQENRLRIQKLQAQKTDLKFQVFDVTQKYKLSQQKIGQLQKFIMTQRMKTIQQLGRYGPSLSLKEQLQQIKKQLQIEGLQKLKILQKQLFDLIIEKSTLKKQLEQLQQTRIQEQSKFSDVYKQIFLMKQKNGLLQQKCQGYERLLNNMGPNNALRFVSVDKDHNSNIRGIQQINLCVVNSISRLDNLSKKIEGSQVTS